MSSPHDRKCCGCMLFSWKSVGRGKRTINTVNDTKGKSIKTEEHTSSCTESEHEHTSACENASSYSSDTVTSSYISYAAEPSETTGSSGSGDRSRARSGVKSFSALDDTELIPQISASLEAPEVQVGDGVALSRPLPFEAIRTRTDRMAAAVSRGGVLAVYSWRSRTIELSSLVSRASVLVGGCVGEASLGFFGDRLLVLEEGERPASCRVCDLFDSPSHETLVPFRTELMVYRTADCSRVEETRLVDFLSKHECFRYHTLDVDSGKVKNHDLKVSCIPCLTGISIPGTMLIYGRYERTWELRMLKEDGRDELVQRDTKSEIVTVIPSSKTPEDLSKVFILTKSQQVFVNGRLRELIWDDGSKCCITALVRLYCDVFLGYFPLLGTWNIFRLII